MDNQVIAEKLTRMSARLSDREDLRDTAATLATLSQSLGETAPSLETIDGFLRLRTTLEQFGQKRDLDELDEIIAGLGIGVG